MKSQFFILIPLVLNISCEKEIELDPEEKEPRIVVNSIFQQGDTICLQISESASILYTGELPRITNASAKLFDSNNNLLGTFEHDSAGIYKLPGFIPQAGNFYHLKVTDNVHNDVDATAYLPSIVNINEIDTLSKGNNMNFQIRFDDNPNEINYYAITILQMAYYFNGMGYSASSTDGMCTNQMEVRNGESDIEGNKCGIIFLFDDKTFNGQEFTFSADQYIFEDADCTTFVLSLRNISEDYFNYKLTNDLYNEIQPDPFSQPVQVYSNIENGFGIFAGYSISKQTIVIY